MMLDVATDLSVGQLLSGARQQKCSGLIRQMSS
jgi:hypothetical protein